MTVLTEPLCQDGSEQTHLTTLKRYEMVMDQCLIDPRVAGTWINVEGLGSSKGPMSVLPIHLACLMQPSDAVFEAILDAFPEGVRKTESASGMLPLHMACMFGARESTIKILLQHHPDAAQVSDSRGRLALHCACQNRASIFVVDALLQECPGSVRAEDRRGYLPLHAACAFGAPELVVHRLVGEFPEAAALRTKKGYTPAMLAQRSHAPNEVEIVSFLDDSTEKLQRMTMFSEEKSLVMKSRKVLRPRSGSVSPKSVFRRSKKAKAKACPNFV